MTPTTCETCRFWVRWSVQIHDAPHGECRRKSPMVFFRQKDGRDLHQTKWPSTRSTDWCGSYCPKVEDSTPQPHA